MDASSKATAAAAGDDDQNLSPNTPAATGAGGDDDVSAVAAAAAAGRRPFTALSQEEADLALARVLQEQVSLQISRGSIGDGGSRMVWFRRRSGRT
jgi:E3 ubiquitin-protein ligase BIG BROTHER-like protein